MYVVAPAEWIENYALRICAEVASSFWLVKICIANGGPPYTRGVHKELPV
jgi:hypothetical protein